MDGQCKEIERPLTACEVRLVDRPRLLLRQGQRGDEAVFIARNINHGHAHGEERATLGELRDPVTLAELRREVLIHRGAKCYQRGRILLPGPLELDLHWIPIVSRRVAEADANGVWHPMRTMHRKFLRRLLFVLLTCLAIAQTAVWAA